MKMALIIGSLTGGGAERVAMNLCEHIQTYHGEAVSCDLIVMNNEGDYDFKGAHICLNPHYDSKNKLKKAIYHYGLYTYRLRQLKKKNRYDVVISFSSMANKMNIQSKKNERCVISIRNYLSLNLPETMVKEIRTLYKKADHMVAVSKACKKDLIDTFGLDGEKISVIYNPYNIDKIRSDMKLPFTEADDEADLFVKGRTLITIGRLSDQKAFWRLVKAIALVKKTIPNIRLLILGKELKGHSQEDLLKKMIVDLDLEDNVHLLGFKINPYQYMLKSDAYVLSSKYEGFPNALTEAMVVGLPVISVDCLSGPREILYPDMPEDEPMATLTEGTYGILVPQYKQELDPEALNEGDYHLAQGIEALMLDSAKQEHYRQQSLKRVEAFRVVAIAKYWLELEV